MGLFKKKRVPEELPSLAVDEVEKLMDDKKGQSVTALRLPKSQLEKVRQDVEVLRKQEINPLPTFSEDEKGFFKELLNSVTDDSDKFKGKFLQEDIVEQMKEYWENQHPQILLQNLSGELKEKLTGKTDALHSLEKEWQEIYFSLMYKEEQIRKEEKELKEAIGSFMKLVKKSGSRVKKKTSKRKIKKVKRKKR